MMDEATTRNWLTLLRCPGLGARRLQQLGIQDLPLDDVLQRAKERARAGSRAQAWLRQPDEKRLEQDLRWLEQPHHHLVCCTDPLYPPQLLATHGPPAALYVRGDKTLLLSPQIAVVGARNVSHGGVRNARMFARALAQRLTITSGLAQGVDACAHQAALDMAGHTVAVLGTGADKVYPARHRDLAEQIAERGALVSEFNLGVGARAGHFPQRNRIISGLSLATLVIEASIHSGSLITARLALEQGREVFAVPGSIHNPLARGCHQLIRDGATLLESVDDILSAIESLAAAQAMALASNLDKCAPAPTMEKHAATHDDSAQILAALEYDVAVAADIVSVRAQLPTRNVLAALMMLELDGHVASTLDGKWIRLDHAATSG